MATYGYARVSSSDQSTDTQVQKLKAAGCQVVRTEKLSGKSREGRDQLATLLEFIGPGDVLVCVKLDRLGRSTRDVLNLGMSLMKRAHFCASGTRHFDRWTHGENGADGSGNGLAEMELGFIKARQRDGIERAKSKGDVYRGRKPTIDPSAVRDLFNEGIGASEIALRLKIGRASVYRVLEL